MNTENLFGYMKVENKCRKNGLGYGNGVSPSRTLMPSTTRAKQL
jgi:hypothetical protein